VRHDSSSPRSASRRACRNGHTISITDDAPPNLDDAACIHLRTHGRILVDRARRNGVGLSLGSGNVLERNEAARSKGYELFESAGPAANSVAKSNKFKKMSRKTRRPRRR
jgi:hypothetical protein